jgi:hypothetical protein
VQTGLDRQATAADRVQTGLDASTSTTQAGIATTQAGIATTQAGISTTQAGIATTQAGNALTSANNALASQNSATASASTATTQAGIATTQAGIATTQAGIATTQASNALTSANEAAASAASAASAALNTPLTGFTTGANSTILATDTTLQAFGKTQGQLNARVSGTGASGQVSFWNGTSSQTGDNQLFWDNTNKRLGVGTNMPDSTLHVRKTLGGNNVFTMTSNSQNANVIQFRNGDNTQQGFFLATGTPFVYGTYLSNQVNLAGGSGGIGLRVSNTSNINFYGGNVDTDFGVNYFRLFGSTGNVLIQNGGTFTDAGFRLDVNGTARVQGNLTTNLTAGSVPFIGASGLLSQDNTNLFWDNTNKRLGVGTNAPNAKFEVVHSSIVGAVNVINTTSLGASSGGGVALRTNAHSTAANQRLGGFFFGSSVGAVEYSPVGIFAFSSEAHNDSSRGGYLTFEVNNNGTNTRTQAARIFPSGNFTLQNGGTFTDNGFRLDVNGTARVQGVLTTTADAVVTGVSVGVGGGNSFTNTRVGSLALNANTSGTNNTAIGRSALTNNNVGANNTAYGFSALSSNTIGASNTANGSSALSSNTTGNSNNAFGRAALSANITGSNNIGIGLTAGQFIADGTTANTIPNNSLFIGNETKALADNQTNQIVIGYQAIGLGSNTTVLGNTSTTHGRWYGSLLLGTTTNAASSILTMESTTQGFLPPRMTTTQRNAIASPATGLMIYNSTDNLVQAYNGTSWINL